MVRGGEIGCGVLGQLGIMEFDRGARLGHCASRRGLGRTWPDYASPPVAAVNQVADLITVTPNPYKITGLNDVRSNASSHAINFLNLPSDYTLTILDTSVQIIFETSTTGAPDGRFTWDLFSKDGVEIASGLYIYHIEYSGQAVTGHFAILR